MLALALDNGQVSWMHIVWSTAGPDRSQVPDGSVDTCNSFHNSQLPLVFWLRHRFLRCQKILADAGNCERDTMLALASEYPHDNGHDIHQFVKGLCILWLCHDELLSQWFEQFPDISVWRSGCRVTNALSTSRHYNSHNTTSNWQQWRCFICRNNTKIEEAETVWVEFDTLLSFLMNPVCNEKLWM